MNDKLSLPERSDEGFLLDATLWTESLAKIIAAEEDITLSEAHWQILNLAREFYAQFDEAPANRALVRFVKMHLGDALGNSIALMRLFSGSFALTVAKIAGLPRPANCF